MYWTSLLRWSRKVLALGMTLAAVPVLGVSTAVPANAAPSFANGSFETPAVPSGGFTRIGVGQPTQSIGPWLVVRGSVDLVDKGFWQSADGNQSVDLDGSQEGAIEQTFSTVQGKSYTVQYSLAGNPGGSPVLKSGHVEVNGSDIQDFVFDITGATFANMRYVVKTFTFLATAEQTALRFVSDTAGENGPVIDAVSVVPAP